MAFRTMDELEVAGRRVLLRLDLNVPVDGGEVQDDTRVREAAPTVRRLAERGAVVIACSHLGKPKGKVRPELSLAPVAPVLSRLCGREVQFVPDVAGDVAREAVGRAEDGDVLLLENLRFDPGEEADDPAFCDRLAALADAYVNDAFGTAHRAHASTAGVASRFADRAAGPLMVREIAAITTVRDHPARPFVAVVGGAKISGKLQTLEALVANADAVALVGGMANTFLLASGVAVGRSLVEADLVDTARRILADAREREVRVVLPADLVVSDSLDGSPRPCAIGDVADDDMILDIGDAARAEIRVLTADAGTVFWNGPAGVFERDAFAAGTMAVARALADSPAFTVVGGGESVMAIHRAGVADRISHVSTGGGASLELLAGDVLPGVAALED